MIASKDSTGTSLKYPLTLENGRGIFSSGDISIQESLLQLFGTPVGSRLMLREYGSRLDELAFEQNDDVLLAMARLFIKEAIEQWERRIKFDSVTATEQENDYLNLEVYYTNLRTGKAESFVYPFYRKLQY